MAANIRPSWRKTAIQERPRPERKLSCGQAASPRASMNAAHSWRDEKRKMESLEDEAAMWFSVRGYTNILANTVRKLRPNFGGISAEFRRPTG